MPSFNPGMVYLLSRTGVQFTKKHAPSVKTLSFGETLALEVEVKNKLSRKAVHRRRHSDKFNVHVVICSLSLFSWFFAISQPGYSYSNELSVPTGKLRVLNDKLVTKF